MKVGKTVWVIEKRVPVAVKLIEFGRGATAEVEYIDPPKAGQRRDIAKVLLHAKPPRAS